MKTYYLRMLKNQMVGKIDSWAIRFFYHQFKNNQLTVYPVTSKLKSIGFSKEATHTHRTSRFKTDLDETDQLSFSFDEKLIINQKLVKEFKFMFSPYMRILDRLRK